MTPSWERTTVAWWRRWARGFEPMTEGKNNFWLGKKFSAAHRKAISRGVRRRSLHGPHHTPEAIDKMRQAALRRHATGFYQTPEMRAKFSKATAKNHAAGVYRKGPTSLELALRRLLTSAGFDFEEQVRFGHCVVDAWVPSHRLVFEADGMFWYHHQDKEREARRDAYLMRRGVAAVVHLDDCDLKVF